MKNTKIRTLRLSGKKRSIALVGIAVLFMIAAILTYGRGDAVTHSLAVEAESGSRSGNAVSGTALGASDNASIRFGANTPEPNPADRVFYDGFESGTVSSSLWNNQSCSGTVTVVGNPVRKGSKAVRMTTTDSCASSGRAQIVSNFRLNDGDEYYFSDSVYFSPDFPIDRGSWLQFGEIYGPPHGGPPTMGFDADRSCGASGLRACVNDVDRSIWTSPTELERGRWHDFVYRVKLSTNASVGFMEVWHNGVKQTMKNGQQRTYYQTLKPGVNWNGSGNYYRVNLYRSANWGTTTLYHDEVAIGKTFESVYPGPQ